MLHLVPAIKRKKGLSFILGRVRHRRDNPRDYSVRVIKRGFFKVVVGERGVYILDDEKTEQIIKESWERYLEEKYGSRRPRTDKDIVEHPVEVKEEEIRRFFSSRGLPVSFKSCAFFVEGIRANKSNLRELLAGMSSKR
ncbi:MAG: hypothetical protein GXO18_06920 [Aquificae bacterium]|nr:hypothetical protein [Aquificota bacterium]